MSDTRKPELIDSELGPQNAWQDVDSILRRVPPHIAESLRLLDTLPPDIAHGYWRENGVLTHRRITTDDLKQAVLAGEYTPQQIRNHVALMRYATGGR